MSQVIWDRSKKNIKLKNIIQKTINGVKIFRVRVPEFSKTNKLSRIRNILAYFFGAVSATFKVGQMDYVFSISQPPILGGLLGIWGKWIKNAKFIYNIQDFNPEQILAVNYSRSRLLIAAMMFFDKFSCRKSDLIITVGCDLAETLKNDLETKLFPDTS